MSSSGLLVSIIVRTYAGRRGWLGEALASLAAQTYAPIEVVLVEDGSDEARADAERLAATRLHAVVYRPIAKGGPSAAGNAGLAAATGDLIGFLDDDDLLLPDHVQLLVAELCAHPTAGAAYSVALEAPTEVLGVEPLRYREHARAVVHRQPFSRPLLWRRNYLPIQSVLFRRMCYERHGGFDPDLQNLEDWNLWTRYSLDTDFRLVDKVTSLYRVPADSAEHLQRSIKMESYYSTARAKQGDMKVTLTVAQVISYAEELTRRVYGGTMDARRVSRLMRFVPFLAPVLRPIRRFVAYLRRRRLP